jgi:hypothetical protein
MTKFLLVLCMTAVVTVTGVLVWKAEATPLTGAADSLAAIKGHLAVQKVGCMFGTHRCPAGTKWSCATFPAPTGIGKKCVCRPC